MAMQMESIPRLKKKLQSSQIVTDSMVTILGSFDRRLASLDASMRISEVQTDVVRKVHDNIERTLRLAEDILSHYDISIAIRRKITEAPREDLQGFLAAVDKLQQKLDFLSRTSASKSRETIINNARDLLSKAMMKLEQEFMYLLSYQRKVKEPENLVNPSQGLKRQNSMYSQKYSADWTSVTKISQIGSDTSSIDAAHPITKSMIPAKGVSDLNAIAKRMINAGHHHQCTKVYREIRLFILNQIFQKFGVNNVSKDDVQKLSWESLEGKIGNWIQCLHTAVRILYPTEEMICNEVFGELDPYNCYCFAEVTDASIILLLSFGDAIVKSKKSPEKLFMLLDMYDAMSDLLPQVRALFGEKEHSRSLATFEDLMRRMGQTTYSTLVDLGEAIEKDATKATLHDGNVHPLTSYVINYLKFLFDYKATLEKVFKEYGRNDMLASRIDSIVNLLINNLDMKAKQFKDPSLMHLFLMNNIHYIAKSVRQSEGRILLGDDWIQRHRRVVQQHASGYQRTSWSKLLQYISLQGITSNPSSVSAESSSVSRTQLKERFRIFNLYFEEIYLKQRQWTVPDVELRESLRLAVAEVLLPAYRSYLKHSSTVIQSGKNPQKYIKYAPEDLEQRLSELFDGAPKAKGV